MNLKKLKKYIYDPDNTSKLKFACGLSMSVLMSYLFLSSGGPEKKKTTAFKQNINVMIPKGHLLFPFTAQNYEEIDVLLEAYSLVKVYEPTRGRLLAENIKVLRAPKDPRQLAFLIPNEIADSFMEHGMDFRLAIQKFTNEEPRLITKKRALRQSNKKVVTYGE
jgi:hypothetical protein